MSNLPNPFQKGNLPSPVFATPPTSRQSSSPGFLMLTRSPDASTIGPDGRGRSMGRANYRSNYRNKSYSGNLWPYNQNRSFDTYRNNQSYDKSPMGKQDYNNSPRGNQGYNNSPRGNQGYNNSPRGHQGYNISPRGNQGYNNSFRFNQGYNSSPRKNQSYDKSPNNSFSYSSNNFSPYPKFHSTPNQFHRGRGRGRAFYHNSPNNSRHNQFHKTPLKDIPIEKFISKDMLEDPWKDLLELDSESETGNEVSSLGIGSKSSQSLSSEKSDASDDSVVDDGMNEILADSSDFELSSVSAICVNSPHHSSSISSSEKDTGTESDT